MEVTRGIFIYFIIIYFSFFIIYYALAIINYYCNSHATRDLQYVVEAYSYGCKSLYGRMPLNNDVYHRLIRYILIHSPNSNNLTCFEATSPSRRNVRSISRERKDASRSSALAPHPITSQFCSTATADRSADRDPHARTRINEGGVTRSIEGEVTKATSKFR